MAIADQTSAQTAAPTGTPTTHRSWIATNWGLLLAIAALIGVLLLPTPESLPVAGHRMLAILVFAVIVWMTEALDYAVSAVVVAALMAFLLGFSPNPANPKALMGTSAGLTLAFSGFANTALVLVASALFLAAAMTATGLDKRIALNILSRVGVETRNVVIGTILVGFVIAFLVPSTTARVACLVPITLGIIAAFGVNKKGAFASMLMITTVQTASIWNVGIKTAAAQNMVAIGFIEKAFGRTITWLEWLIAAAPFGVAMSIALYFVMTRMMPPEVRHLPGGRDAIRKSLADLGPMKTSEKMLLAISLTLLAFWATEGVLHKFDTSTTTITAVALMFLPGIGIMTWKEAQPKIPWGTVVLFGVGISLGTALLQTKGATWLGHRGHRVRPQAGNHHVHPRRHGAVPDRDSSRVRECDGTRLGDDPDRHRSAAGRRDARRKRHRHDHASAVRRELRFHSRRQCASEHGGIRHRDVRGPRLRAHGIGPDVDSVRSGHAAGRDLLALARLRVARPQCRAALFPSYLPAAAVRAR